MTLHRRRFSQATAALMAGGTAPFALAADTLKIGYVLPQTGPLAPFGEADKWVIEQMKTAFKDGISVGGEKYAVQIGFRLDPGWGIWFGHIVFLLLLVLRPQGLFPKTR